MADTGSVLVDVARGSLPTGYPVTVAATVTELVPRDESRIGLVISAGATHPVFLSWNRGDAAGVGILINTLADPLVLSMILHGALVKGPIYASAPAGAQTVYVVTSSIAPGGPG